MKYIRYSLLVVLIILLAVMFLACEKEPQENVYAIQFSTNGGEEIEDMKSDVIWTFPETTREGYYLEGWYTESDFSGSQISFPYEVVEDTKLYARWFTAEQGSPYLVYEFDSEKDEYTVIGYTGKSRIAVIPPNYEKDVTAISDGAFNICNTLLKIVIPSTIENIGRAFYRTSMLKEFEVSPQNTNFVAEDGVLYNSDKTTLISYPPAKEDSTFTIPQSVTSLANSALRSCRYLSQVTVTKNVADMGEKYFDSCNALENIIVDDENQNYCSDDGVLFNKDKTILYRYPHNYSEKNYQIPQGTLEVAPYAFDESDVKSIFIPASVENFNRVEYCLSLEEISLSNDNINYSSVEGVLFDKDIQTLIQYPQAKKGEVYNYEDDDREYYYYEIPDGVVTINSWAFDACSYLNKIIIPSSLKLIKDIAFNNIQGGFELKEIIFEPDSALEKIGESAFMECSDLLKLELTAIMPPQLEQDVFTAASDDFTIYVPDNTFELYQNSDWAHVANLQRGQSLNTHEINFHTNGGQSLSTLDTVYIDSEIIPNREGYVFGGWYFQSDLRERAEFPLAVKETTDLYAKWYTQFDGTDGLSFSLQAQTNTYAVIGYSGGETKVTVPTAHNGKLVDVIEKSAFENKTHITEVTLPETITEIRNYAFAGNFNNIMSLEKVNFHGSALKSIGNYAFSYCQKLNIDLPSGLEKIGLRAFNSCSSLKTFAIPQNVNLIESNVFSNCSQLQSITVNPLNQNYRSDEGVLYNRNQTQLLQYPLAKTGAFEMPDSVVRVKSGAFSGAANLEQITLSENLEEIETAAFHFSAIEEITLPQVMTAINPSVFRNTPIKNITIGKNISEITDFFHELDYLENIYVDEQNQKYKSVDGVLYTKDQKTLLRYPSAKEIDFTLPDGVDTIAERAFADSQIQNITFNDGLKEIGSDAFYENNRLLKITLPQSLETIGDTAFMNSTNLKGVFLTSPSDYPQIGQNTFAGVNNGFHIYAPQDIIDDMQNDSSWQNFDISPSDEVIDGYHVVLIDDDKYKLIGVMNSLTDLIIPGQINGNDIVEVGSYAFSPWVRRIQIPYTVKKIKQYAFTTNLDSQLSTIIFEDGSLLEEIGQNAFWECSSLTNIVIDSLPQVIGVSTITELSSQVKLIADDISMFEGTVFEALNMIDKSNVYGDFITQQTGEEMTIIGYLGGDREIVVPDLINSLPVVSIGKNLINPAITRVVVPSSVEEIEDYAFSANIYNANIYDKPMAIADIVLENGVKTIGKKVFEGLDIKYVNIPASVENIQTETFEGCYSIEAIIVDEMNNIYSSVDGTLYNKDKTTLIRYPSGNKRLEYAINEGTLVIGENAFSFSNNLIFIEMNEELEKISRLAFNNCNSLLSVDLPSGLLKIEAFAFKNCYRIKTLLIPQLVDEVSYGVVIDCSQMRAVYVDYNNENYQSIDGVLFDKSGETLISYPAGRVGGYTIDTTIKNIAPYAFYGSQITYMNIPNSVEQIGKYAFANSNLESITIGAGITQLPEAMLKDCVNLQTIDFQQSNVAEISKEFVMNAKKLNNLVFPASLLSIGERAFYGCSKLNNISLPENFSYIGDEAFANCRGMTEFVMPKSLDNLGQGVLNENENLREIIMSVEYRLNELFEEIPLSLKDIITHDGVSFVPEAFFKDCVTIENVYLSSTVQAISADAFMNCSSLVKVEIPSGWEMTGIGERAFYNCFSLEQFYIGKAQPPSLSPTAFKGQIGGVESDLDFTVYVMSDYQENYTNNESWQNFQIVAM